MRLETLKRALEASYGAVDAPADRTEQLCNATRRLFQGLKDKEPVLAIPRLRLRNAGDNELEERSQELARNLFLMEKEGEVLTGADVDKLWELMQQTLGKHGHNTRMNYEAFRELKTHMPKNAAKFFTPDIFRMFTGDEGGRISAETYFEFLSGIVNGTHLRIALSRYDTVGDGFLTEHDLENYIYEQIDLVPALANLDESFHPFYVFGVVRKFMFLMDTHGIARISVAKLSVDPIMQEFNSFRYGVMGEDEQRANPLGNWFTPENMMRVYRTYLTLDTDHDGMLSRTELAGFNGYCISEFIVDRVFETKRTYDGLMDYKGFLDFILATMNKKHPASIRYFWELLDYRGRGKLLAIDIHTLFRSVQDRMRKFNLEIIPSEDVISECFDMVKPKGKDCITLHDLLHSGTGHTVVGILTDAKGFWEYDNRESQNHNTPES